MVAVVIVTVAPTKPKIELESRQRKNCLSLPIVLSPSMRISISGCRLFETTCSKARARPDARRSICSVSIIRSLASRSLTAPSRADLSKETTKLRYIEPGPWDVGVNLYTDHEHGRGAKAIPVRFELPASVHTSTPQITILFSGNVSSTLRRADRRAQRPAN